MGELCERKNAAKLPLEQLGTDADFVGEENWTKKG